LGLLDDFKMDVEEYIAKQKNPQKEILIKIRRIIKKNFKGIKEGIGWGGYCL